MKHPKIGEIIYAYSDKQERVGKTCFLESTQENATKNVKTLMQEAVESLCYPEEEAEWDDDKNDWIPVFEPERKKDIIIYEMKRIQ